ncbi:MAG TPA: cysteine hydrolase, partial [Myxococcota bacterium]|nr:cysteine hydrolase [Myxococcota bacterium]
MSLDLDEVLDPTHCALVIQECQRGVVGDLSGLPELAENARKGMIPVIAELARRGRAAGVAIFHCTAERRPDGRGANTNARLFQHMGRVPHPLFVDTPATEIVPEIAVETSDFVLPRLHGLSPFQGTEFDSLLRNLGVRTIVGVGVSVNVAIQNLAFDAVNAAYQVVIPRDAVAGFPEDYVDSVFRHTLGGITTVLDSSRVLESWARA